MELQKNLMLKCHVNISNADGAALKPFKEKIS